MSRRGQPEFIDDEDPLLTLALPFCDATGNTVVAVATFLTRSLEPSEDLCRQCELLGMRPREALAWAQPAETVERRAAEADRRFRM